MSASRPGPDVARPLAVIDIDGVLADVRHRVVHLARIPKDWGAFFAAAPDDALLVEGLETVRRLSEVCEIVYLTGRPERCRRDTLAWLARHEIPPGELQMRGPGDRRRAHLVKVEALDRLSGRSKVTVLVDDDPLVCESARAAGYDVLPATWMGGDTDDTAALFEAQELEGQT